MAEWSWAGVRDEGALTCVQRDDDGCDSPQAHPSLALACGWAAAAAVAEQVSVHALVEEEEVDEDDREG